MTRTALITGVTGQDGAYLAELLLEKATEFMVLNGGHLLSIRAVLNIFMRIRMNLTHV